jgi:hypothetical protein
VGLGTVAMGVSRIFDGGAFIGVLQIVCGVALFLWTFMPIRTELVIDKDAGSVTALTKRAYFGTSKRSFRCEDITALETGAAPAAKFVGVELVLKDGTRLRVGGLIANDAKAPPEIRRVYEAVRDATGVALAEPPWLQGK